MKEKSEKKPLKFNWWIFLMQCTTQMMMLVKTTNWRENKSVLLSSTQRCPLLIERNIQLRGEYEPKKNNNKNEKTKIKFVGFVESNMKNTKLSPFVIVLTIELWESTWFWWIRCSYGMRVFDVDSIVAVVAFTIIITFDFVSFFYGF